MGESNSKKGVILSAKWILPIASSPLENGAVALNGSKILDIGDRDSLQKKYPDLKTEHFKRSIIMPGFVDLHTHFEHSIFRGVCDDLDFSGWKLQMSKKSKLIREDEWEISARLGALEAIQAGITTVADMTSSGASLKAAKEAGIRGRIFFEIIGMDRRRTEKQIEESQKTVKYLKDYAGHGLIDIGLSPHSPYAVCPPLYEAISAWAVDEGMQVCTHLAGSKDEYEFVKYGSSPLAGSFREEMGWQDLLWHPTGSSPVEYLEKWNVFKSDVIAVHCVHVDSRDLDILEKNDVSIAHCPKCNAKLAMGIAPLQEFRRRSLRLGLGTDSPSSSNSMDVFDEMRIALFMQRGLTQSAEGSPAEDFIKMSTIGGAKALRLDDRIGTLEPGKEADIIVVDLSHSHQEEVVDPYSALVYSANQDNIVMSMVAGKTIYRDYRFKTLDEKEIIDLAEPVRLRLLKKPVNKP